jgi:septal ring factor EnvC (AmiA/AmiB activator)
MPGKKGEDRKTNAKLKELEEIISQQSSAMLEIAESIKQVWGDIAQIGARLQQIEVGLTTHGEAVSKMEAEFHKLEELVTAPQSNNGLALVSEFALFLSQRK